MHSVMDPDVDLGPGLPRGPDVIMDQMANYSNFLRFISLTGFVDRIVVAEDSVAVSDAAWFTFQVTRSTIEMIFPHIMGSEWLVALLVGKEVEAPARSTFHFNTSGKCYRYDVEMDFVGAFMSVVKNPRVVDMLLGRALISYNGMLGFTTEEFDSEEEKAPAPLQGNIRSVPERNRRPARSTQSSSSNEFCQKIVEDYFAAFASGYEDVNTPAGISQRDFFLSRFGSQKEAGPVSMVELLVERWRVLGECFELLAFQQKGTIYSENNDTSSSCLVVANASYILRVTFYTIQVAFPHLLSDDVLLDALVGKVIMVPSQIFFSIDKTTGYVSRVTERMEFAVALGDLFGDQRDLSRVISQARLTSNGVYTDLLTHPPSSPTVRFQDQIPRRESEKRTMNIADILDD
ncbi:hypothetical protein PHMEG_00011534 [Phytophthora megakarya]|uniref:Uncharacterized protein n=1 Tax=Phytophthora megakarya TaxID=4795 RepID=A0A225WCE6_9STRA|nr:hypothetical protein PHMEG_00011534 [Phytophthora megakarya]